MHSSVSIYIYILVNELPSRVAVLIHIFLLCTDTFIQKTRKLYLDTRTQRNLSKLNDDLFEVQQIMTRNIQEVLGVGDRLDQVSQMSSRLSSESRIFADKAKDLNRQVTSVQTFLVAFHLRGSIIAGLALICALAFSIF
jgi:hypothetical protein